MFCSVTSRSVTGAVSGSASISRRTLVPLPPAPASAVQDSCSRRPSGVLSTVNEPRPHAVLPSALRSTKRNSIWSSVRVPTT